jgi:glycosyltransferase involved in cell wall biosynthesis
MAHGNTEHTACGELSARERAERAVDRGETLFAHARVQEAIEAFEHALAEDAGSTRAHNDLGVVLHSLGRSDDALAHFDAALKTAPDDVTALVNKARILIATDRRELAARCVRTALRKNVCDLDALELMAVLDLPRRGREAKAAATRNDAELEGALAAAGFDAASTAPALSVIATTCAKAAEVIEQLDRLAVQDLDARWFEVVVVDDGAPVAMTHVLAGWTARYALKVVRRERGDVTPAWKTGLAHANGRWSLFLRDGTLPARGTLRAHLLAQARSNANAATAGVVGASSSTANGELASASNVALPTERARTLAADKSAAIEVLACNEATAGGFAAEDRPVFLLGCAYRCGSTFLQRLLSSSPNLFIWGENMGLSDVLAEVIDREAAWRWETYQTGQWKNFEQKGLHTWIANLQPRGFPANLRHALRGFYLDYYREATRQLGRERWGFKEVHHGARAARFLLDLFPAGRVVFVLRNPVDVLASVATTSWYDQVGRAARVAKLWRDNTASILAHGDPRILVVRYEKFVAQPLVELNRIAGHVAIGVDRFDAGQIQNKVRGFGDPPKLGAEELAALNEPEFVEFARSIGYDVPAHPALRQLELVY